MTESTDTADEPAEQPADLDAAPADDGAQDISSAPDDKNTNPNAEAASWRRKYSDQKTINAAQSALIERFQRAEIARIADQRLQDPQDLWREVELQHLVGEDGSVDPALVTIQVDALIAKKPHYARKVPPKSPPASNVTGDGRPPASEPETTWDGVLKDAARH